MRLSFGVARRLTLILGTDGGVTRAVLESLHVLTDVRELASRVSLRVCEDVEGLAALVLPILWTLAVPVPVVCAVVLAVLRRDAEPLASRALVVFVVGHGVLQFCAFLESRPSGVLVSLCRSLRHAGRSQARTFAHTSLPDFRGHNGSSQSTERAAC